MEDLKLLSNFFAAAKMDPRISLSHIGVYAALLEYWKDQGYINPVNAFSSQVMKIAKISTCSTYLKNLRDLSDFGYIKYEPSFKRTQGSKIHFLFLSDDP